ncbi:DUF2501 domain-containing protein [Eoetvoesiella caeni]|uniref:Uncharacterized protein DUF2501 n=2 Tax=Eoetvoesiella caeni TaxID=645616 RepID=A0A366H4L0_9BURK|nr:DUF2501 domain-containing protein [Eoetvoesiella caeni]NYT56583.1 DUF2501 domain-containing protein [Eoetvoesiella caeni]RBP36256.1 uncharacterized protein DUF2501 [Eoetvoesiella caeni]
MTFIDRKTVIGGLLALLLPFAATHAQSGDLLKSTDSHTLPGGSALGGIGNPMPGKAPSTTNINNIAGVLEYCVQNKYLSGDEAESIEGSLKGKLSGMPPSSNTPYSESAYIDGAYADGVKGILHGKDGKPVNLAGKGLKAAATKQICDTVLSTAKSML